MVLIVVKVMATIASSDSYVDSDGSTREEQRSSLGDNMATVGNSESNDVHLLFLWGLVL